MASNWAREKAAQAWCTPKTEKKIMDVDLAEAFAEIIDGLGPLLGMATNQNLEEELATRKELGCLDPMYRTVDGEKTPSTKTDWTTD